MSKITCFTSKNTRLTTAPSLSLSSSCVSTQHVLVYTFKTSPCVPAPRATRQDKTRQDKTRQDKTRQDKTRQDKTREEKRREDKTREEKTRQDKTRQDKRREDKTREDQRSDKIHFQCGGAWPFSVDGVLCLVHPVSDRVISLLHSVKYDSSLISFSSSWQVNSFFISAIF